MVKTLGAENGVIPQSELSAARNVLSGKVSITIQIECQKPKHFQNTLHILINPSLHIYGIKPLPFSSLCTFNDEVQQNESAFQYFFHHPNKVISQLNKVKLFENVGSANTQTETFITFLKLHF